MPTWKAAISVLAAILVLGCISTPPGETTTTIRKITVTTLPPSTLLPQKQVDSVRTALSTGDPAKCQGVSDTRLKSLCLSGVARETKDPATCVGIPEPDIKDMCYYQVSQATGNKTLCEMVVLDMIKVNCEKGPTG